MAERGGGHVEISHEKLVPCLNGVLNGERRRETMSRSGEPHTNEGVSRGGAAGGSGGQRRGWHRRVAHIIELLSGVHACRTRVSPEQGLGNCSHGDWWQWLREQGLVVEDAWR